MKLINIFKGNRKKAKSSSSGKTISARSCVWAYDVISELDKVKPIPAYLRSMEQKTAGGIMRKLQAIINSEYFKSLPTSDEIPTPSGTRKIKWKKSASMRDINEILNP